jgi:hypothetical protein
LILSEELLLELAIFEIFIDAALNLSAYFLSRFLSEDCWKFSFWLDSWS